MYATADDVRKALPNLLTAEEDLGVVASGNYIELQRPAYHVPTLVKNGTELVEGTDFTFTRPYSIELDTVADGEYYIANVYYGATDTELENLIQQADRKIDSFFANYQSPAEANKKDWSAWFAAALYLRQYGAASKETTEKAESIEEMVTKSMQEYRDNVLYNEEKSYPTAKRVYRVDGD